MRSSTFSSSDRAPSGAVLRPLLAAFGVAMAILAGLEFMYRAHGLTPHILDSPGLVARVAREAHRARPAELVLAGSSRGLHDVDAPALSVALGGRRVLQLSQDGISCLPVLEELAMESAFAGTLLCTLEPTALFGTDERERERTGLPRIRLPRLTWAGLIDVQVGMMLRSRFTVLGRDILTMGRPLLGQAPWPSNPREGAWYERVSDLSFAGNDTAALDRHWADLFERAGGRADSVEELAATIAWANAMAHRIESRGGHVLFVELPSSGRTRATEVRRFPRARYWDVFAANIYGRAFTVRDEAGLDVTCPDGSHLGAAQTVLFSQRLAGALLRRGLLARLETGTSARP